MNPLAWPHEVSALVALIREGRLTEAERRAGAALPAAKFNELNEINTLNARPMEVSGARCRGLIIASAGRCSPDRPLQRFVTTLTVAATNFMRARREIAAVHAAAAIDGRCSRSCFHRNHRRVRVRALLLGVSHAL
jgi:hypothetical protein